MPPSSALLYGQVVVYPALRSASASATPDDGPDSSVPSLALWRGRRERREKVEGEEREEEGERREGEEGGGKREGEGGRREREEEREKEEERERRGERGRRKYCFTRDPADVTNETL